MKPLLSVKGISASVSGRPILAGVTFEIQPGEVHVIMGPNGAGKSTLINAIMGNPKVETTDGSMHYQAKEISKNSPQQRAADGIFMAFQYPREIAGVQIDQFLYTAYQAIGKARGEKTASVFDFNKRLQDEAQKLHMRPELMHRNLNEGFSGGEKKKAEMLQLAVLEPTLALLDETDSGLDVDALKVVGESINRFMNKDRGALIVTHYHHLLDYVRADKIHIMVKGKIVRSGGTELVAEIESKGFEPYITD